MGRLLLHDLVLWHLEEGAQPAQQLVIVLSEIQLVAVSTDISMNKFVYVINADENDIVQDEAVNQIQVEEH